MTRARHFLSFHHSGSSNMRVRTQSCLSQCQRKMSFQERIHPQGKEEERNRLNKGKCMRPFIGKGRWRNQPQDTPRHNSLYVTDVVTLQWPLYMLPLSTCTRSAMLLRTDITENDDVRASWSQVKIMSEFWEISFWDHEINMTGSWVKEKSCLLFEQCQNCIILMWIKKNTPKKSKSTTFF